jgi:hypothetical protein
MFEHNRGRLERRSIAVRAVTPEQMGLAGAQQLAQIQRTRTFTGGSFVADNLCQAASLATKLAAPADDLSKSLREALLPKIRKTLSTQKGAELEPGVIAALVRGLNKLAKGSSLYNPIRFPDHILSAKTRAFREANPDPKGKKLAQFNRLLLRDAYPQEISTEPTTETNWLATSREPDKMGAEDFLNANRQYWGIENGTHQRLDCSASEDLLRVREPNAVAVLGLFQRMSLRLFKAWAKTQSSQRDRTYPTWQDHHIANRWRMIRQVTEAPTSPSFFNFKSLIGPQASPEKLVGAQDSCALNTNGLRLSPDRCLKPPSCWRSVPASQT